MSLEALVVDQSVDFLLAPLVHVDLGAAVELRSARFLRPFPLVGVGIVGIGVLLPVLVHRLRVFFPRRNDAAELSFVLQVAVG